MYHREQGPPHFHVVYGGATATVDIRSATVLHSTLPPRVRRSVLDWTTARREALLDNWRRGQALEPLLAIDPLD